MASQPDAVGLPLGGDFVHCPPRTAHTIVTVDQPALILGAEARKERGRAAYPVEPVAISHGSGLPDESTPATEVYASFGSRTAPGRTSFRERGEWMGRRIRTAHET